MIVTRIIKAKPLQWDIGIVGYEIQVSSDELGLPSPKTVQEAQDIARIVCAESAKMGYAAMVSENVLSAEEAKSVIARIEASVAKARERVKL